MFVCLSVRSHISKVTYPNFTKFSVGLHVDAGHSSVFLWRWYNTLCTSGFVIDVMFSHEPMSQNQRQRYVSVEFTRWWHRRRSAVMTAGLFCYLFFFHSKHFPRHLSTDIFENFPKQCALSSNRSIAICVPIALMFNIKGTTVKTIFAIMTARRYASLVYAVVCVRPSVCPSVCHKPALYQNS